MCSVEGSDIGNGKIPISLALMITYVETAKRTDFFAGLQGPGGIETYHDPARKSVMGTFRLSDLRKHA